MKKCVSPCNDLFLSRKCSPCGCRMLFSVLLEYCSFGFTLSGAARSFWLAKPLSNTSPVRSWCNQQHSPFGKEAVNTVPVISSDTLINVFCLWDATGHPARIQIFHADSGAEVNVSGLAESVRDAFKRSCRSSSNSLAGKRGSRCLMVCKSWLPLECFTGRWLWKSLVEMVHGKDFEKNGGNLWSAVHQNLG